MLGGMASFLSAMCFRSVVLPILGAKTILEPTVAGHMTVTHNPYGHMTQPICHMTLTQFIVTSHMTPI